MIDIIIEYIKNDPISFTWDVILSIGTGFFLCFMFLKNLKLVFKILISIGLGILSIVFYGLEIRIIYPVILFSIFLMCLFILKTLLKNPETLKSLNKHSGDNSNDITFTMPKEDFVNDLVETILSFSYRRMGAIITIEKNDSLNVYKRKSIKLNAEFSKELLKTIFFPNTALHDGAVIIKGSVIESAAVYYPLSDNPDVPSNLGTRHRAALGISEETDALSIVVSEETGSISYTIDGTITTNVSEEALRDVLNENINY